MSTIVPCSSAPKAAPAFAHLLKQANCGGMAFCDGKKMKVAYVCMSAKSYRALSRSIFRETSLMRRHRLARSRR